MLKYRLLNFLENRNFTEKIIMLKNTSSPLLLCNVWDVTSAKIAEQLGYECIGTSSGAIAAMLGYPDGEYMSFKELYNMVERIINSVNIPLSVDLEAGYSRNAKEVAQHIKTLQQLGVVGVNLEDSLIINDKRALLDAQKFSGFLYQIIQLLSPFDEDFFINIRTDTFLLASANATKETIFRATLYKKAGAHGLFVPCIESAEDIQTIAQAIDLPLNVMCMPNLPGFETLKHSGVERISMGNFVFNRLEKHLAHELKTIQLQQSFQNLFQS